MKRIIVSVLFLAAFGWTNHANAQFNSPGLAWGLSMGGAQGNNDAADRWGMQYRGFLQADLLSDMFVGQVGLGYTELWAPNAYSAATGMLDARLLFSPFSMALVNPYLYGGFGVSKSLKGSGNDYLAMIPVGLGIQTRLSSGVLLQINGGYTLSLSDKLDGRVRSSTDLNSITNGKQDGFYGFTVGLAFALGGGYGGPSNMNHGELSDSEARRVKQQADGEARRVKDLADAEARRVKQQADADAEALRVKAASDAEAMRMKAVTDAEALRLAEQKRHDADTVFVFTKGATVVLRGINFEFNKATLEAGSEKILWRAYNAMKLDPNVEVVITGHTDSVGTQAYNQQLSLERAQTVRNWLVGKGIASNRMRTVGRGENETVASNDTDAGRAENRRIEFYVQK